MVGCYREQGISLDCGFENMGWSKIYFTDVGVGCGIVGAAKLLVKCRQTLTNWIKKSPLFCFCRMFVTSWPKDLFYLKREILDYNSELSSIDTA